MTAVHLGTRVESLFGEVDPGGDLLRRKPLQMEMRQVTVRAALDLFEALHAGRNTLRREWGLPELPMLDVAVVLLAFVRTLPTLAAKYGREPTLAELREAFDDVTRGIEERREREAQKLLEKS